jgi:hypothetical protein
MKAQICFLVSIVVVLLALPVAPAQVTTATVYGTIVDASGAAVPGTVATFVHEGTGAISTAKSNTQGQFTASLLPVGSYTVTLEAKGFKASKRTGLSLTAGQQLELDVSLDIGNISETVAVSAEAPILTTTTAEASAVRGLPW